MGMRFLDGICEHWSRLSCPALTLAQCRSGLRSGASPMTTYRVQNESDGKADSPDGVLEVVEKAGPGYYDIEELNANSRPSCSIAQHWGKAIHIQDDGVTFETHHGDRYTKKFLLPA